MVDPDKLPVALARMEPDSPPGGANRGSMLLRQGCSGPEVIQGMGDHKIPLLICMQIEILRLLKSNQALPDISSLINQTHINNS